MWELQQLSQTWNSQILISAPSDLQWSSTTTSKSTRSKVSNITGYSRNFHSISSPIFLLKAEISKNLEPTGQFLQYINLCCSKCYFFQRIFLDMLVMSQLFYSTDRAGLCLQVQNANEHINKIQAGPNLDLITQSQGKDLLIKYLSLFRPPLNLLQLLSHSHFLWVCGDCPVSTECPILFWIFMDLLQNHLDWKRPLRALSPTFDLSGQAKFFFVMYNFYQKIKILEFPVSKEVTSR